jgi:hypothetical protein
LSSLRSSVPDKLDVVFTWVDPGWPGYQDQLHRFSNAPTDLNPERFRDDFQFLRYSLRALESHFPRLGRVFLFTARPQVPAWLDTSHPRFQLVHHDSVGAPAGVLPTFNSNVIESLLHLIPDLGSHFLYFTDDCLLGAETGLGDLYTPDGRLRLEGTWLGEHFRVQTYQKRLLSFGLLEHGPVLIDKSIWAEMLDTFPADIAELRTHRFRQDHDLSPTHFYRWYALTHRRREFSVTPFWRYLRNSRFIKLANNPAKVRRQLERIGRKRPRHYCLNDDLGPAPDPTVAELVQNFLQNYYPAPSSFEI